MSDRSFRMLGAAALLTVDERPCRLQLLDPGYPRPAEQVG